MQQEVYCFIDSGSAVTMAATGFIKRLGLENQLRPSSKRLVSFSQDAVSTRGEIELELKIGSTTLKHTFIVTDLLDTEFLIGDDFLRTNKVTLDYSTNSLRVQNGTATAFIQKPRNVSRKLKVRCNKTTVIPPCSIRYISCKLPSTNSNLQGVIEPRFGSLLKVGILSATALVHSQKRWVPVKCVNATDGPVTVYRNKVMATLEPVGGSTHGVTAISSDQDQSFPEPAPVKGVGAEDLYEPWTRESLFKSLRLDEMTG